MLTASGWVLPSGQAITIATRIWPLAGFSAGVDAVYVPAGPSVIDPARSRTLFLRSSHIAVPPGHPTMRSVNGESQETRVWPFGAVAEGVIVPGGGTNVNGKRTSTERVSLAENPRTDNDALSLGTPAGGKAVTM